jgi:hypothetical protein
MPVTYATLFSGRAFSAHSLLKKSNPGPPLRFSPGCFRVAPAVLEVVPVVELVSCPRNKRYVVWRPPDQLVVFSRRIWDKSSTKIARFLLGFEMSRGSGSCSLFEGISHRVVHIRSGGHRIEFADTIELLPADPKGVLPPGLLRDWFKVRN